MNKTELRCRTARNGHPHFWAGVGVGLGAAYALPKILAWIFLHPPRHVSARNPRSVLGIDYELVRLRSADGISLSAWYVPVLDGVKPRGVVVINHGYTGNRATMLSYLPFLHEAGYAVLMLEFRAHGWSGGRRATFGPHESRDLHAMLDWVNERDELGDLPIALLGESMGAAVALLVAADDSRVRAVVADSPFARFDAAVRGRMHLSFGPWLGPLLLPSMLRTGESILGVPCESIAPEEAIGRIAPRPVLLIHGTADRLLHVDNSRRIYAAAGENVTFWEVEGAGHVQAVHTQPREYALRVVGFLNENLGR